MKEHMKRLTLSLVALYLSGCAATSVFSPYPNQAQEYRVAIDTAKEADVLKKLDDKRNNADKILYMMERGRVGQLAGLADGSLTDFSAALDAMDVNEDKAKLSLTDTSAQGASLMTNDNAIPYKGEAYERIFVHHYQALNYLDKQDLEGAGVEIRRANQYQVEAAKAHDAEIAKAEEQAQQNNVSANPDDFATQFAAMDAITGKVKSSFQNAYTFYLSGLIYEAMHQDNDAYIDYKKAIEIFPDNRYLQNDVLRLAQRLSMREDYDRYSKQFNRAAPAAASGAGSVAILYEEGFVAAKNEISIPLPTIHGWVAVAFPIYNSPWQAPQSLAVSAGGTALGSTETIVDIHALAAKSLKEHLPGMLVRQTLRAGTKYAMQKEANDRGGILAGVTTQIYNIVSERADLRSWLTLPRDAQILRGSLPSGSHTLTLSAGIQQQTTSVTVQANRITLLHVVNSGSRLIVHSYTL
jgi:hypothetical protein